MKFTSSPNVKSGHGHNNIKPGSSHSSRGNKKGILPSITGHTNGPVPTSAPPAAAVTLDPPNQ